MLLKIKNPEQYIDINIDIKFPFYRHQIVSEDHDIYYKFDSPHKVMIIETLMSTTKITFYDETVGSKAQKDNPVTAQFLTKDLIDGHHSFNITNEMAFNDQLDNFLESITKHLSWQTA